MKKILVIITILSVLFLSAVYAENTTSSPVINNYTSEITVEPNSTLLVKESINITTDGTSIQHGIYRDFPTHYQNKNISFKLENARLNDANVAFHTKQIPNGIRIYLGSKDSYLKADTYTFTITYTAQGELGFFKDHDELYWNVTGNGWSYPISNVKAIVHLPDDAWQKLFGYQAYTGSRGSKEQNYRVYQGSDHSIIFETTQPLMPNQGLTIVVGWPKGFVTQPSFIQTIIGNVSNLLGIIPLLLGLIVLVLYCIYIWNKSSYHHQIVIPEYEPPRGFDPAALRYILEMGYDDKVLTALILNLAVKGYLTITQNDSFLKRTYTLSKLANFTGELSSEEQVIVNYLFASSNSIEIKYQPFFEKMLIEFQSTMKKNYDQYFTYFNKYINHVILITLAFVGITVIQHPTLAPCLIAVVLLYPFSRINQKSTKFYSVILITIVFVAMAWSFLSGAVFSVLDQAGWVYLILFSLMLITNLCFAYFIKQPTPAGETLINHIKGFKLFLNATEKDRMNFRNPPEQTPQLFEKYLPYALALSVEQTWAQQFNNVLAEANYQPKWYIGNEPFVATTFVSSISSNLSSLSQSETVGASSGFSGGSSGGGGGGGGGGGW